MSQGTHPRESQWPWGLSMLEMVANKGYSRVPPSSSSLGISCEGLMCSREILWSGEMAGSRREGRAGDGDMTEGLYEWRYELGERSARARRHCVAT